MDFDFCVLASQLFEQFGRAVGRPMIDNNDPVAKFQYIEKDAFDVQIFISDEGNADYLGSYRHTMGGWMSSLKARGTPSGAPLAARDRAGSKQRRYLLTPAASSSIAVVNDFGLSIG
jgi:hypothetical protein